MLTEAEDLHTIQGEYQMLVYQYLQWLTRIITRRVHRGKRRAFMVPLTKMAQEFWPRSDMALPFSPEQSGSSLRNQAIYGKRNRRNKDLRSHLGIQLESSHTEGPPITSRLCCSLSLGLKIWAKLRLGNRILGFPAHRALDRE